MSAGPVRIAVVHGNKEFFLDMEDSNSIDDVRIKLEEIAGIPRTHQRLIHEGKWLRQVSKTLLDWRVQDGARFELIHQPPKQMPSESQELLMHIHILLL